MLGGGSVQEATADSVKNSAQNGEGLGLVLLHQTSADFIKVLLNFAD